MLGNEPDWQGNKLGNVFETHDSAIWARSKEGSHYTTRALFGK